MDDLDAPRILIADDDASLRAPLADILTEQGAVVTAEPDGALAAQAPFDACVLDFEMPVMNGLDACRGIRSTAFSKDLPVLVLTGRSDKETIAAAFAAGAWDFLNKPVQAQQLWCCIANMLTLSKAARQSRKLETLNR